VRFVELAAVDDPAAVVGAVAATLSVTVQAGLSALESVLEWCCGRRPLLLLDNCVHVLRRRRSPTLELCGSDHDRRRRDRCQGIRSTILRQESRPRSS
jgi:predicted ATPase